jgi:hypothetical protein
MFSGAHAPGIEAATSRDSARLVDPQSDGKGPAPCPAWGGAINKNKCVYTAGMLWSDGRGNDAVIGQFQLLNKLHLWYIIVKAGSKLFNRLTVPEGTQ